MKDLSPRQREILALVAAGRTSKEIAGELGISESTVNWHLSNVFERLGASSRAEAVAIAMRDADGEAVTTGEPRPPARPPLPVSEVALAFVLTLLLGLIGGALIAEWDRNAPPAPLSPASSRGDVQSPASHKRSPIGSPSRSRASPTRAREPVTQMMSRAFDSERAATSASVNRANERER